MNKRRLGRGLDALLGREEGGFEPGSLEDADLMRIPIEQIDPNPFQPRKQFDPEEIHALADSLRQHGMLQPVLVRPMDGRYQIIVGERRLRASVEAQLHEIPARVMELDDQHVCEFAMVENLQREDLNPLDKASAFREYLDRFGGTQEELAVRLGLDRSTISNLIRLLELPEEIQQAVRSKIITAGHARALLGLDDPLTQIAAFQRIVADNLSVRQTEALVSTGEPTPPRVRLRRDPGHAEATPSTGKSPHFVELEDSLRERYGTSVMVRMRSKEKGQIIVEFSTPEEFERVSSLMRG